MESDKKEKELRGITVTKEGDFSKWYREVLEKAEMIEKYNISGCYILRPWCYGIWEQIQYFFDSQIKKRGVQNAYFPLLVSQKVLQAEESHFSGFSAEVAWVTKGGKSDLQEPLAIRPTSETVMYPLYAKWIRSHRDLPLKLNQWCNVVRWEFSQVVPLLRSREFLWQEGHTAHATLEEAAKEVRDILDLYRQVYEDLMAIPVTMGQKTENEKFAGGFYTTTCEAFIPTNGRGIQAATSHCLGQNFSKMFDISFEDEEKKRSLVWQNSWGLTTRSIGVLVMTHGDDKGLILPPRVAPTQIVIVPIYYKDKENEAISSKANQLFSTLQDAGYRVQLDDRRNYTPGVKYAHWEMKGIPLRLELGPKDVEKNECVLARRDWREGDPKENRKVSVKVDDLVARVKSLLDEIHNNLFSRAKKIKDEKTIKITKFEEFLPALDSKNIVLLPFCDEVECEESIKDRSATQAAKEAAAKAAAAGDEAAGFGLKATAKSLCKPFDAPPLNDEVCIGCNMKAKAWTLFGRSY